MHEVTMIANFVEPHYVPGTVLNTLIYDLILFSGQPYEVWPHYYLHFL